MKPRHVPMRTCVVCRESRPKRELLRIVRTADDTVEVDPSGRLNGRGGYLCADADEASHWGDRKIKGRLEQALKVSLKDSDIERLKTAAASA